LKKTMPRPSPPNSERNMEVAADWGTDEEPTLDLAASPMTPALEGVPRLPSLEDRFRQEPRTSSLGLRHTKSMGALSVASSSDCGGGPRPPSFCMSDSASMASLALGRGPGAELVDGGAGLEVPSCFRCPIGQQTMEDPVLAEDGNTYERANLVASGYSGEVYTNQAMKEAIEGFFDLQAQVLQRERDWQDYMAQQQEKVVRKLSQRKQQVRVLRAALEMSRRRSEDMMIERKNTASKSIRSTTGFSLEAGSSGSSNTTQTPPESERSGEKEGEPLELKWAGGRAPRQVPAASPVRGQPRRSSWAKLCVGRGSDDEA